MLDIALSILGIVYLVILVLSAIALATIRMAPDWSSDKVKAIHYWWHKDGPDGPLV